MKIGLKLWSLNTDSYLPEARRIYSEGVIDYVELYVVPDTLNLLPLWKGLKEIPIVLHAPHLTHSMNLALPEYLEGNCQLFEQIKAYWEGLNASGLVLHGGTNGNIEETARQIGLICKEFSINPKDIYLENKPFLVFKDKSKYIARGASPQEIGYVQEKAGVSFCLDIAHALCSANVQGIDPYDYITQFSQLKPKMFHLNDELLNTTQDEHRYIGDGEIDFPRIFKIIGDDITAAIETIKDSPNRLDDFVQDVARLRSFIN